MSEADKRQVGGDHYKTMKVQPWDAMEAWLTREEFIGFLRGNIIKYHARANSEKEPREVMIGKAAHYQQKLDEVLARDKPQPGSVLETVDGLFMGTFNSRPIAITMKQRDWLIQRGCIITMDSMGLSTWRPNT